MNDVYNLHIGDKIPDRIMSDSIWLTPDMFKFDFTLWEVNLEAVEADITINKIIIKKFKPNIWLIRSARDMTAPDIVSYIKDTMMKLLNIQVLKEQGVITNYKTVSDAGGYYGIGVCLTPLYNRTIPAVGAYPWECGVPGGNLKNPNYGWNTFGYNNDGLVNIFNSSLTTVYLPSWYNTDQYRAGLIVYTGNEDILDSDGFIDISTSPIIISIPAINETLDVTTIENWEMYLGDKVAWYKNKTVENCWKEYKFLYPDNWNLQYSNPSGGVNYKLTGNVHWIDPTTLRVSSISSTPTTIIKSSSLSSFASTPNYKAFKIKVINKGNATIKFYRRFINVALTLAVTKREDLIIELTLNEGINEISAYSRAFWKYDANTNMDFTEVEVSITGTEGKSNIIIEFIPIFNTAWNVLTDSSYRAEYDKLKTPLVTDNIEDYIKRTKFNVRPANADEFWAPIKNWYANNISSDLITSGYLFAYSNLDEITLNLTNRHYQYGGDDFNNSTIHTVHFHTERYDDSEKDGALKRLDGGVITSFNNFFRGAGNLKTITVDTPISFLVAATDFRGCFEYCGSLEEYPANLIDWYNNRGNAKENTMRCSPMSWSFEYCSSLKKIPNNPGPFVLTANEKDEDHNTIMFSAYEQQVFFGCTNLKVIEPILDMRLVRPNSCSNLFDGSKTTAAALTSVKIKNLNHGDWNFDGIERPQFHGNLDNLDNDSIVYLFTNLSDLKTCNPAVHDVNKAVSLDDWNPAYGGTEVTKYYQIKTLPFYLDTTHSIMAYTPYKLTATLPHIISVTANLDKVVFNVYGLNPNDEGDYFLFENGTVYEAELKNGKYEVNDTPLDEPKVTKNGAYAFSSSSANMLKLYFVNDNAPAAINSGNGIVGGTRRDTGVELIINNGLDYSNPLVSTANLYCPESWRSHITSSMLSNALSKGWTIYIGNVKAN